MTESKKRIGRYEFVQNLEEIKKLSGLNFSIHAIFSILANEKKLNSIKYRQFYRYYIEYFHTKNSNKADKTEIHKNKKNNNTGGDVPILTIGGINGYSHNSNPDPEDLF